MSDRSFAAESRAVARYAAQWLVVAGALGLAVGSAVALFLAALDAATRTRTATPWLLMLLPVAGAVIGVVYQRWGKGADAGNNLIIDEIHQPGGGVPARMAPLVLVGTIVTHLFGGSAGREGTAVQIGGAFASAFDRMVLQRLPATLRFDARDSRVLLQAGMAAGFGAVFGTPLAGTVFALEVLSVGAFSHAGLIPCAIAALVGDWTVALWSVHHVRYPQLLLSSLGVSHGDAWLFAKVALAGVLFGLASQLFAKGAHAFSATLKRLVTVPWLRPVVGGVLVIALTYALGTRDYLGLGVTAPDGGVSIVSSFADGGARPLSWFYKTVFTVVTVGSGFKGGEVTPLFFIGASLGNALAVLLHAPVVLFAALGFVAVFSGATNTPLACTLMGLELFGADAGGYIALACFAAYLCSGRTGIYASQRRHTSKTGVPAAEKHESPA